MKKKVGVIYKGKCALALALALFVAMQTVISGNLSAIVRAEDSETSSQEAGSDHKVTIFYGYGGRAGTNNTADSVFAKDKNVTAYSSTAKSGFTDGDFYSTATTGAATAYGQVNAPAAVTSVDVIYGGLIYTFNEYVNNAFVYLSSDGKSLNIDSEGTKLMKFGGSNAWNKSSSSGVIRFFYIAEDLTIVYHYADEVTLSVDAGDGASYTSDFPGYSVVSDDNTFTGYSRPRTIDEGFDTVITYPDGKEADSVTLMVGSNLLTIGSDQLSSGFYVNSAYEVVSGEASDTTDVICSYGPGNGDTDANAGTLTVYTIKENISFDVNYDKVSQQKTITVIGAEGSSAPISTAEFPTYVDTHGGSVDTANGIIQLDGPYSDSTGLAMNVNAAYGTVSEIVVTIGEHTIIYSGSAITETKTSYVNSSYNVTTKNVSGDILKYAHTGSNKYFSFRFYVIKEDITIEVHYTDLEGEIADTYGVMKTARFDYYPEVSDASIEGTGLTMSSRYLRGNNAYSYRTAFRAWDDDMITGFQISDSTGETTATILKEDGINQTITAEGLGKVKYAYSDGAYYLRVLSQTVEKLIISPIVVTDTIHVVTVTDQDGAKIEIESTEFSKYVASKGGKVEEENGRIALLKDYSSSTGLDFAITADYGSLKSIQFQTGTCSFTISRQALLGTTVLYGDVSGKKTEDGIHSDKDIVRYEHSGFSSTYNFRLYEVSDDVTITLVYGDLLGDFNGDGAVTATDAEGLRQILAASWGQSDEEQADYNQDSKVDVKDLVRMKKYLAELPYSTAFDDSLYYQNTASYKGADPSIIYVDQGEYAGTFFLYVTSSALSAKGFQVYSSKNLTDWTLLGTAFTPDTDDWATGQCWAPEVLYDNGLYYMFYSARWGEEDYMFYISVAVSDSPAGPFKEMTTSEKTASEPLLIFEEHVSEIPSKYRSTLTGYLGESGYIKVIDASPFVDPVTGKKYLYFVADIGTDYTASSFVFGLEMEDWGTPKYSTLTKLTSYGYTTASGTTKISEGGDTNEGPFMYYHEGTYYLTFSTNVYTSSEYQVRQAIGKSPLGTFTKVAADKGGAVIYTDSDSLSYGTGHHSFVEVGDELWIAYHTLANDVDISDGRVIAVDKVNFVKNSGGQTLLSANGATRTMQPLPSKISGYEDVSAYANVSAKNGGGDTELLRDGVIAMHSASKDLEFRTTSGNAEITYDFEEAVTLRSILVYNSSSDSYLFDKIKKITLYTDEGTFTITDLLYDMDARTNTAYTQSRTLYDLAAAASFEEMRVNKVVITFEGENAIGIPEIRLIGKK